MVSKMNELIRCRDCGKQINKDQQQNFFSLCYECFRRFKSSNLRKAFALRLIGKISLSFVLFYVILFSIIISFSRFRRTGLMLIFVIGSIIAITIPLLLIYFGVKKKRKWKTSYGEKPIVEKQELITTASPSENSTHIKYCPECGTKIVDVNQKFCMNCGTEI